MNARAALVSGCVSAALAVIAGAFGAHALRDALAPQLMGAYQTAVEYHFLHSLGLVLLGLVIESRPDHAWLRRAAVLMLVGIVLFSGSLYLLALTGLRGFGLITPFGGAAFIFAWLAGSWGVARG
jgi:uncharacterized membrane protein YgdD (TMEM256/DUF423 family)